MEKLVVLDLTDQSVDIYNIDGDFDFDEDFITFLGHDIDHSQWMVIDGDLNIVEHKGIWTKDSEDNYDING